MITETERKLISVILAEQEDSTHSEEAARRWKELFEEIKPWVKELAEESTKRVMRRNSFTLPAKIYNDIQLLLPLQMPKEKEGMRTRTFGPYEVNYYFTNIPKGAKLRFGRDAQAALIAICNLAIEQGMLNPTFIRNYILKLLGKPLRKDLYDWLNDVLFTLTSTTYEIKRPGRGKDYFRQIGHLVNSVTWHGTGKNSLVSTELNPHIFQPLFATPKTQFYSLPRERETKDRDVEAFFSYLDTLQGLRTTYPVSAKTILSHKLGYSAAKLKKLGQGKVTELLTKVLTAAKEIRGVEHKISYPVETGRRKDPLNWQIVLKFTE